MVVELRVNVVHILQRYELFGIIAQRKRRIKILNKASCRYTSMNVSKDQGLPGSHR